MNNALRRLALHATAAACIGMIASKGICADGKAADAELARGLSAAIDTWHAKVEFFATYSVREGHANTAEDAVAGKVDTTGWKEGASGVHVKKKNLVRHPSGAQFALGDGSVRYLAETIEHDLDRALSTRAGHETVGVPR